MIYHLFRNICNKFVKIPISKYFFLYAVPKQRCFFFQNTIEYCKLHNTRLLFYLSYVFSKHTLLVVFFSIFLWIFPTHASFSTFAFQRWLDKVKTSFSLRFIVTCNKLTRKILMKMERKTRKFITFFLLF